MVAGGWMVKFICCNQYYEVSTAGDLVNVARNPLPVRRGQIGWLGRIGQQQS